MFKFLEGGTAEITRRIRRAKSAHGREPCRECDGEQEEHTQLYPSFAKAAAEEGFPEVATMYKMIGVAEAQHEKRYRGLLANLSREPRSGRTGKSTGGAATRITFTRRPKPRKAVQPASSAGYFELLAENW